jgi:hypothetical protein
MFLVESHWLNRFNFPLCPKVVLPFKKQFSRNFLEQLVEKIEQLYVLPSLVDCYFVTTNFDLWMSRLMTILPLQLNF